MSNPNVILIIADDMGYGDLSGVNGGLSSTPGLDALAAESMRLTQAYSASCVCAPARAGLMTGRYPHRTGCTSLNDFRGMNELSVRERTLGDLFQAAGYATGLVGKWHLGETPRSHPNRRGFDEFCGFVRGAADYWNWQLERNGSVIPPDGRYLTDVVTGEAIDFVKRHAQEPFFLYVGYYTPHRPLQAPADVLERYLSRSDLTPGQAHIYAMLEVMDTGIARLNETLAELGLDENTIVMFTSDNGPDPVSDGELSPLRPNVGLHGSKYHVYEGGIRVPFLLRWPGGPIEPGDSSLFFHFIDVAPSLIAACGLDVEPDEEPDGENRWPELSEGRSDSPTPRYWQWNRYRPALRCNAAMRDGPWKLVFPGSEGYRDMLPEDRQMVAAAGQEYNRAYTIVPPPEQDLGPAPSAELYNLIDDPGESVDLAGGEPQRVSRMTEDIERWFESVMGDFEQNLSERFASNR